MRDDQQIRLRARVEEIAKCAIAASTRGEVNKRGASPFYCMRAEFTFVKGYTAGISQCRRHSEHLAPISVTSSLVVARIITVDLPIHGKVAGTRNIAPVFRGAHRNCAESHGPRRFNYLNAIRLEDNSSRHTRSGRIPREFRVTIFFSSTFLLVAPERARTRPCDRNVRYALGMQQRSKRIERQARRRSWDREYERRRNN